MHRAKLEPIAICRLEIKRAATPERTEIRYSYDRPPIWQVRRSWRLHKHLKFMHREDRKGQ